MAAPKQDLETQRFHYPYLIPVGQMSWHDLERWPTATKPQWEHREWDWTREKWESEWEKPTMLLGTNLDYYVLKTKKMSCQSHRSRSSGSESLPYMTFRFRPAALNHQRGKRKASERNSWILSFFKHGPVSVGDLGWPGAHGLWQMLPTHRHELHW